MKLQRLLERLNQIIANGNPDHRISRAEVEKALVEFIGETAVIKLYDEIVRRFPLSSHSDLHEVSRNRIHATCQDVFGNSGGVYGRAEQMAELLAEIAHCR